MSIRRGRLFTIAFGILILLASFSPADAHTRSQSFSTWRLEGADVVVTYTIAAREVTRLPPPEPGPAPTLPALLAQHLLTQLGLEADGSACPQHGPPVPLRANEGEIIVELRFRCLEAPARTLTILNEAMFPVTVTHVHFARVTANGASRELIFVDSARRRTVALFESKPELSTFLSAAISFLPVGIEHILGGLDHLAFIVGLLLATASLRALVIALTGFTLGHSLSLALAVLGYARAEEAAIEAMIAATIALVALAGALRDGASPRLVTAPALTVLLVLALLAIPLGGSLPLSAWAGLVLFASCYLAATSGAKLAAPHMPPHVPLALLVTTLFGIIHGFGFAGALNELDLPRGRLAATLLGFNLGVELGQLLVVILLVLLARLVSRFATGEVQSAARIAVQAALLALATFWFVDRTFL